jgi:hypothetical protein
MILARDKDQFTFSYLSGRSQSVPSNNLQKIKKFDIGGSQVKLHSMATCATSEPRDFSMLIIRSSPVQFSLSNLFCFLSLFIYSLVSPIKIIFFLFVCFSCLLLYCSYTRMSVCRRVCVCVMPYTLCLL